ncbi:MAG: hypothetical protein Q9187_003900 [Circinaria calcarea]
MAAAKSSKVKSKGFIRRTNSFSSSISDSLDAIKSLSEKTKKMIKRCVSKFSKRLSKEAKHHRYRQTQVPREDGTQPGDGRQRTFEKKDREEQHSSKNPGSSAMFYTPSTDSGLDNGQGPRFPGAIRGRNDDLAEAVPRSRTIGMWKRRVK